MRVALRDRAHSAALALATRVPDRGAKLTGLGSVCAAEMPYSGRELLARFLVSGLFCVAN
jgi:hypothetical protein